MQEKTILCPKCGRKIFELNREFHVTMYKKCEKCKKLVIYNPKTKTVKMAKIPKRNTSSGAIFY